MGSWKRCLFPANDNRSCRHSNSPPKFFGGVLGIDGFGGDYSSGAGLEFVGEMADCFCVRALGAFGCPVLFDYVVTIGGISRMICVFKALHLTLDIGPSLQGQQCRIPWAKTRDGGARKTGCQYGLLSRETAAS